jgi:pSer/pThr/pTyr-binding forkhead associated (FHA) protein
MGLNEQTVVDRRTISPSASQLRLTVLHHGTPTGQEFSIADGAIVGRFHPTSGPVDVDLSDFQGGDRVSRRHGLLFVENNRWYARDLQSTNGLFLRSPGGETIRVFRSAGLEDGAQLSFGPVTMRVTLDHVNPPRSIAAAEPSV